MLSSLHSQFHVSCLREKWFLPALFFFSAYPIQSKGGRNLDSGPKLWFCCGVSGCPAARASEIIPMFQSGSNVRCFFGISEHAARSGVLGRTAVRVWAGHRDLREIVADLFWWWKLLFIREDLNYWFKIILLGRLENAGAKFLGSIWRKKPQDFTAPVTLVNCVSLGLVRERSGEVGGMSLAMKYSIGVFFLRFV